MVARKTSNVLTGIVRYYCATATPNLALAPHRPPPPTHVCNALHALPCTAARLYQRSLAPLTRFAASLQGGALTPAAVPPATHPSVLTHPAGPPAAAPPQRLQPFPAPPPPSRLQGHVRDATANMTWLHHWGLTVDWDTSGWKAAHRPGKVGGKGIGGAGRHGTGGVR